VPKKPRRADRGRVEEPAVPRQWRPGVPRRSRKFGNATYTPAYYRYRRKKMAGWMLVGLGLLVAGSHLVTHLGYFTVMSPPLLQDAVMGYPTAAVLAFIGVVLLNVRA